MRFRTELADRLGLTAGLPGRWPRGASGARASVRPGPARLGADPRLRDCLADLRAIRDQSDLSGRGASDAPAFRVIDAIGDDRLAAIRPARVARRDCPRHRLDARHRCSLPSPRTCSAGRRSSVSASHGSSSTAIRTRNLAIPVAWSPRPAEWRLRLPPAPAGPGASSSSPQASGSEGCPGSPDGRLRLRACINPSPVQDRGKSADCSDVVQP